MRGSTLRKPFKRRVEAPLCYGTGIIRVRNIKKMKQANQREGQKQHIPEEPQGKSNGKGRWEGSARIHKQQGIDDTANSEEKEHRVHRPLTKFGFACHCKPQGIARRHLNMYSVKYNSHMYVPVCICVCACTNRKTMEEQRPKKKKTSKGRIVTWWGYSTGDANKNCPSKGYYQTKYMCDDLSNSCPICQCNHFSKSR